MAWRQHELLTLLTNCWVIPLDKEFSFMKIVLSRNNNLEWLWLLLVAQVVAI